jgi:hypothetical protein
MTPLLGEIKRFLAKKNQRGIIATEIIITGRLPVIGIARGAPTLYRG